MNRTLERSYGFGDHRGYMGGYVRKYPREYHTPPMQMWYPHQQWDPLKVEFGNELNNPQPIVHHHLATRSSGRILRLPAPNSMEKAWSDNMIQDSQWMYVKPDATLTGTLTGAAVFPQQLPSMFWIPYNRKDQLGGGHI